MTEGDVGATTLTTGGGLVALRQSPGVDSLGNPRHRQQSRRNGGPHEWVAKRSAFNRRFLRGCDALLATEQLTQRPSGPTVRPCGAQRSR